MFVVKFNHYSKEYLEEHTEHCTYLLISLY